MWVSQSLYEFHLTYHFRRPLNDIDVTRISILEHVRIAIVKYIYKYTLFCTLFTSFVMLHNGTLSLGKFYIFNRTMES